MDWVSPQHPRDVVENGVATCDDMIQDWRETSLVCNIDIMDVILSSDAEYLMLTFCAKAHKDTGIFSTHSPRLRCIQKGGENKCLVCLNPDGQHQSHHIFDKDAIVDYARVIRLLMSDWH